MCYDSHLIRAISDLSFSRDMRGAIEVVRVAARELMRADGVTFVLREGDPCHYLLIADS